MHLLRNTMKPYAWGSESGITDILGVEPSGSPEAELWIGAHPQSPSEILTSAGDSQPLDAYIEADSGGALGESIDAQFAGRLPYLMKILAAAAPLSIQVHPSREQAIAGFAAENAAGVPIDAPHRNYKDPNHKPEMIYALTTFEALCGFREPAEAADIFSHLSQSLADRSLEAEFLDDIARRLHGAPGVKRAWDGSHLRSAFHHIILNKGGVSSRTVERLREVTAAQTSPVQRELQTVHELHDHYPADPGALVALLLNRISMQPGEALYLPAGNVHAYLRGVGIEVMASSDNVLRGGLTPKHVDIRELMDTIVFEAISPPLIVADDSNEGLEIYRPPFDEFQLQRIAIPDSKSQLPGSRRKRHVRVAQNGPSVVLVLAGELLLESAAGTLAVGRGQSAFVPATASPVVATAVATTSTESTLAFAVTVAERSCSPTDYR